ncbi:uncharacterized protein [Rutidosis leptorrhynchoides]|uniref:uncharacterized protein n=1 Tax=Rutidosis leptorrhynchoides TaxID=125765 RepID=UPI003A9A3552
MADEGALLVNKLDFGDSLYLHPSDIAGTPLINRTENYKIWSRSIMLALGTKNKLGCNSVVLSWLLGSIYDELYSGLIFSDNATTVWTELKETYDKVDGSVTFNIHHKINSLKQNGSSLSEYYHSLNSLWKHNDAMIVVPTCTCIAAAHITNHNKVFKLMQFLMGLDDCYMAVRSNLLLRDPLPDVKTAFAVVSREESHRGVSVKQNDKSQSSLFIAQTTNKFNNKFTSNTNSGKFKGPNPNLQCTKCNKTSHTIDRCFEIIGYPTGYKRDSKIGNNLIMSKLFVSPFASLADRFLGVKVG